MAMSKYPELLLVDDEEVLLRTLTLSLLRRRLDRQRYTCRDARRVMDLLEREDRPGAARPDDAQHPG